jgi:hypothetical protein
VKAYSHDTFLPTFSANSQKHKCMLRDSVSPKEQKFKRWELGVSGGVNFQQFKNDIPRTYGYRHTSYPLTEHINTSIQYSYSKNFGVKLSLGYDKFGYKVQYNYPSNWPYTFRRYKFEKTFFVHNLGCDFLYKIILRHKFSINTCLGFKTSLIQKEIAYYADFEGSLLQERFYSRKPYYRFNLHACAGLQLSYSLFNRIYLNTSLYYYNQIFDYKDYLDVPLAGYKEWQRILRINHFSCSFGLSCQL